MRLDRHQFARLLATVGKVVEARNTIPILATIRLIAGDGKLAATASDLDIEISGSIDADGEFAACIDARLLTGIVSKAAGDSITIEATPEGATLKAGRSRYQLQTLPIDDFPTMAADGFTAEFTADLSAVLGQHAFAMSDEETRYYLRGVFLEPEAATATNGHKLSTASFDKLGDFAPVIVPAKTVGIVPKQAATVRLSATKIQFQTADAIITSKLVDGSYPDWRRIMPSANDKLVTVDGGALKAAAERTAVISDERERGVKLDITGDANGNSEIVLYVHGNGEAQDSVPCSYDGEPITIGFAVHYLAEILASLPAGDVTIALADNGSPALFTSANDEGRRVVLMPRRI